MVANPFCLVQPTLFVKQPEAKQVCRVCILSFGETCFQYTVDCRLMMMIVTSAKFPQTSSQIPKPGTGALGLAEWVF